MPTEAPPLPDDFWEEVAQLSAGDRGVISSMKQAGMDMTRQAFAIANWNMDINELDAEALSMIPACLPDDPE